MNIKRILLIGLILVAVAASLSIVSADNSVKVGGIDFNIPDGFTENETMALDHVSGSYPSNDGELSCSMSFKGFKNGKNSIAIGVIEFDSQVDAKKAYDYAEENVNVTSKTVNGHERICYKETPLCEFDYCTDKYFISITVSDESLLEKVVPK